jgi:hypothetical protein
MGRLAIGILLAGLLISFHNTIWGWAGVAVLAWGIVAAIEMRYNKKLWE